MKLVQRLRHSELGKYITEIPNKVLENLTANISTYENIIKEYDSDIKNLVIISPSNNDLIREGKILATFIYYLGIDLNSITFINSSKATIKQAHELDKKLSFYLPECPIKVNNKTAFDIKVDEGTLTFWSHPNISKLVNADLQAIGKIVEDSTHAVTCFWSFMDLAVEQPGLQVHGFSITDAASNPYAIESRSEGASAWAQFVCKIRYVSAITNSPKLAKYELYSCLQRHAADFGFANPLYIPNVPISGLTIDGWEANDEFIGVIDDLILNLNTKTLYQFDIKKGILNKIGLIAPELLNDRPSESDDISKQCQWGLKVKLVHYLKPIKVFTRNQHVFEALSGYVEEHEDPYVLFQLGIFYEHGLFPKQDIDKAVEMYVRSSERGFSNASYRLASIYLEYDELDLANEFIERAISQGSTEALIFKMQNLLEYSDCSDSLKQSIISKLLELSDDLYLDAVKLVLDILADHDEFLEMRLKYLNELATRNDQDAISEWIKLAESTGEKKYKKRIIKYSNLLARFQRFHEQEGLAKNGKSH